LLYLFVRPFGIVVLIRAVAEISQLVAQLHAHRTAGDESSAVQTGSALAAAEPPIPGGYPVVLEPGMVLKPEQRRLRRVAYREDRLSVRQRRFGKASAAQVRVVQNSAAQIGFFQI